MEYRIHLGNPLLKRENHCYTGQPHSASEDIQPGGTAPTQPSTHLSLTSALLQAGNYLQITGHTAQQGSTNIVHMSTMFVAARNAKTTTGKVVFSVWPQA